MHVYSNKSDTVNDYVEIIVSTSALVCKKTRRNITGYTVSSNVFSKSSKYDGLVGLNKNFYSHELTKVQEFAKAEARKYGLSYDRGLTHRRKLWSV